jgi:hypothetical protein
MVFMWGVVVVEGEVALEFAKHGTFSLTQNSRRQKWVLFENETGGTRAKKPPDK